MGFSRQEYWSGLPFPSPVSFNLVKSLFIVILTQVMIWMFLFDLKLNFKRLMV